MPPPDVDRRYTNLTVDDILVARKRLVAASIEANSVMAAFGHFADLVTGDLVVGDLDATSISTDSLVATEVTSTTLTTGSLTVSGPTNLGPSNLGPFTVPYRRIIPTTGVMLETDVAVGYDPGITPTFTVTLPPSTNLESGRMFFIYVEATGGTAVTFMPPAGDPATVGTSPVPSLPALTTVGERLMVTAILDKTVNSGPVPRWLIG
jgi:hypothetical protein